MDEHFELLDLGGTIRRHLLAGERAAAWELLGPFADKLMSHIGWEERGVFRALRDQGEFVETIAELEQEHLDLDEELSGLDLDDPGFEATVFAMLDDLIVHIDKENLGIFPVSTVTLNAAGWDTIERAQRQAGRWHHHDHAHHDHEGAHQHQHAHQH